MISRWANPPPCIALIASDEAKQKNFIFYQQYLCQEVDDAWGTQKTLITNRIYGIGLWGSRQTF